MRALLVALALPCLAVASRAQALDVAVAHSYLSAQSLGQPATFFLVGAENQAALSKIDASLLLRGGMGTSGFWESGVRALAGSARAKPERIFGALARATWDLDPVALTGSGEYEADGSFDVEKGVLSAEATPESGLRGLGRPWSPGFPLRWRPWLGAGMGNVFKVSGAEDPESGSFFRAWARLEATCAPSHFEFGADGTLWAVEAGAGTRSYARGTVAYKITKDVSLDLTGEIGRQPPRFARVQSFQVGLGFHHPFDHGVRPARAGD